MESKVGRDRGRRWDDTEVPVELLRSLVDMRSKSIRRIARAERRLRAEQSRLMSLTALLMRLQPRKGTRLVDRYNAADAIGRFLGEYGR